MTIKHTRKDIASEPGDIVLNLTKNTPALKNNNQNENYNNDLVITLRKQNQYNEILLEDLEENSNINAGADLEPYNDQQTISIPLSELVRLKYLQANYYTKNEIDTRVKVYIHVLNSESELPQQGQSNYIYLTPPEDNTAESPNYYNEFIWTDANQYELVGSTQTNISGLLRKDELNAELLNASNFTSLQSSVNSLSSHTHHNITNDGKLPNANEIVITDGNKYITSTSSLDSSKIKVANVYTNIGNTANQTLPDVFTSLNTTIGTINTTLATLPNYLLKSEIPDEIWGTAGFRNLQTAETNNTLKTMKLGDYIYNKVYTKNDIDTLIGTLAQLQQQTLSIL